MRTKSAKYSKCVIGIFVAIFALTFFYLSESNGFLKPQIVQAANPGIGLSADNPGIKKAIEVQSRHTERLMAIPGVVGHGVGAFPNGEAVIKIFVTRAEIPGIPASLESIPTKVVLTGMIVAYADPTARFPRPVPIGVSTGHPDITAGTIGCRVTDGTNVYALSNNHVYANQNDASIGDNVLQPGPYDGGQDPDDAIGILYDFEPIDFSGGNNVIDAAIALSSINELGSSTTAGDGYGTPSSTTASASVGLEVQKYGRTTAWTHGKVDTIDTTVDVCYQTKGPFRCTKLARFADQIAIIPGAFSAGGDSGSLIVTDDENRNPVGLLFAGGTTHTIANPIDLVLSAFGVWVDNSGSTTPGNDPPTAVFSYTTSDCTVTFTDESYDSDGSVVIWNWDFGDGNTSTVQNPTHIYPADGNYTVRLIVTDNLGATGSYSQSITISTGSNEITLTATGVIAGFARANLEWSGAAGQLVDIYRNGILIINTANDGEYSDKIGRNISGSFTYKVCESGSSVCSNEATVAF